MKTRSKSGQYIAQAWLVILLAILYGGGLAGVQVALSGRIAENKRNETYGVIPELVPGASKENTEELVLRNQAGNDVRVYKIHSGDGVHIGWVVPAAGQGFADRIELLTGLDAAAETITGIYVLDQKETPGLGDYIRDKDFRSRFEGKPAGRALEIVKDDPTSEHEIRTLTGATISSESVADIVNKAAAGMRETLRGAAAGAATQTETER